MTLIVADDQVKTRLIARVAAALGFARSTEFGQGSIAYQTMDETTGVRLDINVSIRSLGRTTPTQTGDAAP